MLEPCIVARGLYVAGCGEDILRRDRRRYFEKKLQKSGPHGSEYIFRVVPLVLFDVVVLGAD